MAPTKPSSRQICRSASDSKVDNEERRRSSKFSLTRFFRKISQNSKLTGKSTVSSDSKTSSGNPAVVKRYPGPVQTLTTKSADGETDLPVTKISAESKLVPVHPTHYQADTAGNGDDRAVAFNYHATRPLSLSDVDDLQLHLEDIHLGVEDLAASSYYVDDEDDTSTPRATCSVLNSRNIPSLVRPPSLHIIFPDYSEEAQIMTPPSPSHPPTLRSLYRCDTLTSFCSTNDLSTRATSVTPSNIQIQGFDKDSCGYIESECSRRSSFCYSTFSYQHPYFPNDKPSQLAKESKWRIIRANLAKMKDLTIPPLTEEVSSKLQEYNAGMITKDQFDTGICVAAGAGLHDAGLDTQESTSNQGEDGQDLHYFTAHLESYKINNQDDTEQYMGFSFSAADKQSVGSRRSNSLDYCDSEYSELEVLSRVVALRLEVLLRNYMNGQNEDSLPRPTHEFVTLDESALALASCSDRNGNNGGNGDDSDYEDDTSKRQPATTIKDINSHRFACPYYKWKPSRYDSSSVCASRGFNTIHRMKEHLYSLHRRPVQCMRCLITFENRDQLMIHEMSSPPCLVSSVPVDITGFDSNQEERLRSRESSLNQNSAKEWIKVYQILFPDVGIMDIPNPYIDSSICIPRHETMTQGFPFNPGLSRPIEVQHEVSKPRYARSLENEPEDYPLDIDQPYVEIRSPSLSPINLNIISSGDEYHSNLFLEPRRHFELDDTEAILLLYIENLRSLIFREICSHVKQYSPNRQHPPGNQSKGGNSTEPTSTNEKEPYSQIRSINLRSKRPLKDIQGDDSEDEESPDNAKKLKCEERQLITMRKLSCPYFKWFPDKHSKCSTYGFSSAARVKEHIYRQHKAVIRCGRCLKKFDSQDAVTEHLRGTIQCELRVGDRDESEGISEDVEKRLKSRKGMKGRNEERRWKDIFHILFKDVDENDIPDAYIDVQANKMEQFKPFILENLPSRLENLMSMRLQATLSYQRSKQPLEQPINVSMAEQLRDINTEILAELPSMLHGIFSEFEMGHRVPIPSLSPTITTQDLWSSTMEPPMSVTSTYNTSEPSRLFSNSVISQNGTSTSIDPQSSRLGSVSSHSQSIPSDTYFNNILPWIGAGAESKGFSNPSACHPPSSSIVPKSVNDNQKVDITMPSEEATALKITPLEGLEAEQLLDLEDLLAQNWDFDNGGSLDSAAMLDTVNCSLPGPSNAEAHPG